MLESPVTVPGLLTAGLLAIPALAVWTCACFLVPSRVTSIFRYRLWRVRDQIFDDVAQGRLPSTPFVVHLRRVVEEMIVDAPRLTAGALLAAPRVQPKVDEAALREVEKELQRLTPAQVSTLNRCLSEVQDARRFKLLAGSAIGWPVFLVYLTFGGLWRGLKTPSFSDEHATTDPRSLQLKAKHFSDLSSLRRLEHCSLEEDLHACVS